MNNNMPNVNELSYAQWLEDSLREIICLPVESVCIVTKLKGGATYASYYECTMTDKILMAGRIQQDSTIEMLRNNGMLKDEDE